MKVGDKIKGFKFDDDKYPTIGYAEEMDDCIGLEGEIEYIGNDYVNVFFSNKIYWNYPLELASEYLVINKSK